MTDAAVLVAGDQAKIGGLTSGRGSHSGSNARTKIKIKASQSILWPDSLDIMGWDFSSSGFHVIFSQDIPTIVRTKVADATISFLNGQGLSQADHYLLHPGGKKVLDAYRNSLGIAEEKLDISEQVLKQYGNMSSCTVLYVLDEFLRQDRIKEGQSGLIAALGPGFSLEMLLVEGR